MVFLFCFSIFTLNGLAAESVSSSAADKIKTLAGEGAIGVWDEAGNPLFLHNEQKSMVPASILKILTASAFLHYYGLDHSFQTHFYYTGDHDLIVKGFGDPWLISEEWDFIIKTLKAKGINHVRDIVLDTSHFALTERLPGQGRSTNPYDALNSSISANFNTAFVTVKKNIVQSAEEQTPLTAIVKNLALQSGRKGKYRFPINKSYNDVFRHCGELIKSFLMKHDISTSGAIREQSVPAELKPFYVHRSRIKTETLLKGMMKYSNNFIANQLFLSIGAQSGIEGDTYQKSLRKVNLFIHTTLGLQDLLIIEGSGLSRKNAIQAIHMKKILHFFTPYKEILQFKDGIWSKTGTLRNICTLAGYYLSETDGRLRSFVILLNGKKCQRDKIITLLKKYF